MAASGQITVTTAGTAVAGPDEEGVMFAIKAHPDNTDTVWFGFDDNDDVTSSTGFPLDPGETIIVQQANLKDLRFDADVSGEKFAWTRVA
jgi:hypothetical protein